MTRTKLAAIVDKAMRKDKNRKLLFKIFDKIINATAIELKAGKCN